MPITRLPNGKLIFFAHVPKCAGSSVEDYLHARFGRLGMIDRGFSARTTTEAWSLSPPQHIPETVRQQILPNELFDAIFATVRHPVNRLISVFRFQKHIEGTIPDHVRFERWLEGLERTLALNPYAMHGHIRPMDEIVPAAARVFRIEDGLAHLISWIDQIAQNEGSPRKVSKANVLAHRMPEAPEVSVTSEACDLIARLYAADYKRFGYETDPAVL